MAYVVFRSVKKAMRQTDMANGIEVEKGKQQEFFELVERFRNTTDTKEAKRLGDELGRMVFGS